MRVLYEGDTIPVRVSVVDESGAALDLTGMTVTLRIGLRPGIPARLTKELRVTDAAAGIAETTLTPDETTDLVGVVHYEVVIQPADGTEEVVAVGSWRFVDTVRTGV